MSLVLVETLYTVNSHQYLLLSSKLPEMSECTASKFLFSKRERNHGAKAAKTFMTHGYDVSQYQRHCQHNLKQKRQNWIILQVKGAYNNRSKVIFSRSMYEKLSQHIFLCTHS